MLWRFPLGGLSGYWKPKPKLTIGATDDVVQKLDELRALTNHDYIGLLRRALAFYDVAVQAVKAGKQLQIVSPDGEVQLIDLDLD